MQDHSSIELRPKHLNDNIEQDLALRKKYEDALRYEDDPRPQWLSTSEKLINFGSRLIAIGRIR